MQFPASLVPVSPRDTDDFTLVDLSIGYRLPDRWGLLSLEVNNVFNEQFSYQDLNFYDLDTNNPRFIPDRTIFARVTLNF